MRPFVLFLFLLASLGSAFAATPEPKAPVTLDDQFSSVARIVPEFGGMYAGNATLEVYLTDVSPAKATAVRQAITMVFGAGAIPKNGIHALPAKFAFQQLRQWYSAMTAIVSRTPGVTMTDIDEAHNRLLIGIEKETVRAQVLAQLTKTRIPAEAVALEVTTRVVPVTHTLQDRKRPVEGGYQIQRSGGSTCSLGFNAYMNTNVAGFVTASHCTPAPWAVDGSIWYQSVVVPANLVGTETADPPGFTCPPAYPGLMCRWSDTVFVKYSSGVPWGHGFIGRTTAITTNWLTPNISIDHSKPSFHIIAPPSQPFLVGLTLDKVGRTSGWSEGTISNTCADFTWSTRPNSELLCQYVVHCPSNGCAVEGDSGSPVFRITNLNKGYAELYGVLWARYFGSHVWFIFSPITGVQADLGQLDYANPCILNPNPC
ncbi:MAG: hypothetical protein QOI58_3933 [Thermoanaerobaculia bacterium]|jgi:hypothetical protein|nr:hypothetical protein [Thermoanaerobaculia bacterium]